LKDSFPTQGRVSSFAQRAFWRLFACRQAIPRMTFLRHPWFIWEFSPRGCRRMRDVFSASPFPLSTLSRFPSINFFLSRRPLADTGARAKFKTAPLFRAVSFLPLCVEPPSSGTRPIPDFLNQSIFLWRRRIRAQNNSQPLLPRISPALSQFLPAQRCL